MPRRDDISKILADRLRPDRDRAGRRVRLLRDPGLQGAARGGLRGRPRQLEPGDDHDRPRVRRPHLRRAAAPRGRRRGSSSASGPTRCCRRSAARPRSTSPRTCTTTAPWSSFGVELIGADYDAIHRAEDREVFRRTMGEAGLRVPWSLIAESVGDAEASLAKGDLTLPAIIRPAFTMGGQGGGAAHDETELRQIVSEGLAASPINQVLVEESVLGWGEFELELMRDRNDNVIVICSIENIDPMGVHTGDSVTVAPGADAHRRALPGAPRPGDQGDPRGRGRDRRLQRPVRRRPGDRRDRRDRDEPARLALLGAGVEGDRLPDRQDRRPAGRRLHARRDPQRHHPARRRRPSSRRSTTSSRRSRASPSRSSPAARAG